MMNEMGSIMTHIIIFGLKRDGFVSNIGTIIVNDKLNTLQTVEFSDINFLILIQITTLTLMIPLLYTFFSFIGLL
jgi:ABC-type transporter Mla maintaining outer membrane lipid asymmetry permease subunit MlaE